MAASAIALPRYKRKESAPVPESRGWKVFWALPAITGLLLLAHGGRVVERVYLPMTALLGLYLCLKFPRVYLAFAVQIISITGLVNRIAMGQSVFRTKSSLLAAPFLVVALGGVRMWRARPPGIFSLVFTLPLLAIAYAAGVTIFSGHLRLMTIPLASWLCPIFFGLYCYANEDENGVLAKMYVQSMVWAGVFIAVYGLLQYASPFQWDIDWLSQMQSQGAALSMGTPEPFAIRIFSSVSSPASASVFLATGILLLSRIKSRWRYPAMACAIATLVFTSVRAAWLAFALAAVILLLRASAAARVQVVVGAVILVMVALAAGQTPQGDAVLARFNTFGDIKQDHSLRDRQLDIHNAMAMVRDKPFGGGLGYLQTSPDVRFSTVDVGAVAIPIDLGYLGTLLYLAGLLISFAMLQIPEIYKNSEYLGLAVVSLLPIFLLADEDLLASFAGILFFAPTALLMYARVHSKRAAGKIPGGGAKRSSLLVSESAIGAPEPSGASV